MIPIKAINPVSTNPNPAIDESVYPSRLETPLASDSFIVLRKTFWDDKHE